MLERMKPSCSFDEFITGAQVKMERIGENQFDLRKISDIFRILEHIQHHSLDGRLGSDRHEDRGGQRDSVEGDLSDPCGSSLFEYSEFEFGHSEKEGKIKPKRYRIMGQDFNIV